MDLGTLNITIKAIDEGVSSTLNKIKGEVAKASQSMEALGGKEKVFTKLGSGAQKIGRSLTNHITKPAIAAAAAIAGIVLVKGWNRLKQIDDARAKLEGLGHSGQEVDEIMKNCLASVKGTAFGLDDAATVAASAVAAGVKQGKQLENYLTTVANVAAISGSTMDEIGSIFNKVQTAGKLSMEEVNQLSDRGVPVLTQLAKKFGVSNEEMRKLISEGKVSAKDLEEALDYTGAAVVMGSKSMTGALANVWASVGRIGANFLDAGGTGEGFFTAMKPLLAQFTVWLSGIEEKAISVGTVFGQLFNTIYTYLTTGKVAMTKWNEETESFETEVADLGKTATTVFNIIQPLLDRVRTLFDLISQNPKKAGWLASLVLSLGPIITIFGKLLSGIGAVSGIMSSLSTAAATAGTSIGGLIAPIAGVVAIIAGIVAAFGIAYSKSEEFRNAINSLGKTIMSILKEAFVIIKPLIQTFIEVITEVATAVAPLVALIGKALAKAFQVAKPFIIGMVAAITTVIQVMGKIITVLAKVITAILNFVSNSQPVKAFIAAIEVGFAKLGSVLGKIGKSFDAVTPMVDKAKASFETVKAAWLAVLHLKPKKVFKVAQQKFKDVKNKAKELFNQWKTNLSQKGTKTFTAVKKNFEKFKSAAVAIFNQWKKNLAQKASKTFSVAKKGFESVKSAMSSIKDKWQSILNMSGVKKFVTKFSKQGKPTNGNGHRVGLREVPYDNYIATLHKGETVLTAAETNQYKKFLNNASNQKLSNNQSVMVNQVDIDYTKLAKVLYDGLNKVNTITNVQIDGKTLAQATAPMMKSAINTLDTRANRKLGYV